MRPRDFFDALLRHPPAAGGDGACRARTGERLDLELYKFDACPYCQVVFRAVRRLALPVRFRDIVEDEAAARKLVAVGGRDQVPCLFVDGKPLYESDDIVAFLEANFTEGDGDRSSLACKE